MATVALNIMDNSTQSDETQILSANDQISFRVQGSRTSFVIDTMSDPPALVSVSHSHTCHCADPLCPNNTLF